MDRVVIGDSNQMTTMNENIHWMKLTHIPSFIPLSLRFFLMYVCLYFRNLHCLFFSMHQRKTILTLFILCTIMFQLIPIFAHMLVCNMVQSIHPLGVYVTCVRHLQFVRTPLYGNLRQTTFVCMYV